MLEFDDVRRLPIKALACRGISEAVAKRYGVRCEVDAETGEPTNFYFPLTKGTKLVGYQRKAAKAPGEKGKADISRIGETKQADPFGAVVAGSGAKMVIVTEGAEDALAAVELLAQKGKNYRVVATLGTQGWKNNMEFFLSYEKVVIAFDQDGAGRQAAASFAAALSPGQAVLMRWTGPCTDPNALLLAGEADRFLEAVNSAKPHRPDGIIHGEAVWRVMENYVEPKYIPYPEDWPELNAKIRGMREAEVTMFTGGSSVGKTAYTRRLKRHILKNSDWKIGEVELEEQKEKTYRGLMEAELGKAWRDATKAERRAAFEATYGTNRIFHVDHRSQFTKGQSLVAKFKHLYQAHGCRAIFLDHVTLAVNEFGDGIGNPAQDQMMNEFLEFVESTGCHLFLISHLRKSSGGTKSFEEGAVPSMDDLKGSGSLKQISFNIIGVSRNLMHPDEYQRNVSQLHVMKCRETGKTGSADRLYWDDETKRLVPAQEESVGGEPGEQSEF